MYPGGILKLNPQNEYNPALLVMASTTSPQSNTNAEAKTKPPQTALWLLLKHKVSMATTTTEKTKVKEYLIKQVLPFFGRR